MKRRGRDKQQSPDSAIFVFTRLPRCQQDLQDFFLRRRTISKARDVSNALMDKNSRELLLSRGATEAVRVGLSIVDTSCNFGLNFGGGDAKISQAFSKFLQGVRGNVVPLERIVDINEGGDDFGSLVASWFVPCQDTFSLGASTVGRTKPSESSPKKNNLLKLLQRQCMPPKKTNVMKLKRKLSRESGGDDEGVRDRKIPRRMSNESSSSRRSSSEGGTRAQRLVRLSSTTLETRKQTSQAGGVEGSAQDIGGGDDEEKARFVAKFNSRMEALGPEKTVDAIGQLQVLKTLLYHSTVRITTVCNDLTTCSHVMVFFLSPPLVSARLFAMAPVIVTLPT